MLLVRHRAEGDISVIWPQAGSPIGFSTDMPFQTHQKSPVGASLLAKAAQAALEMPLGNR